MCSSSTRSIYGSNSGSIDSGTTITNTQSIIVSQVLDNPTYNLDRFLGRIGQIPVDERQRPPPGLGQTQDVALAKGETEAEAKERISAQLQEFDIKFGYSGALSRG